MTHRQLTFLLAFLLILIALLLGAIVLYNP